MKFPVCFHDCNHDQSPFNIDFQDSAALQSVLLLSRNVWPLLPLGLRLGLMLILKDLLYSIVEADNRFVVSVQFFRLVPDG